MRLAGMITAALLLAGPAAAMDGNVIDGTYRGGYVCAQGTTFLELVLDGDTDGFVRGTFRFNSAEWAGGSNRTVPEGKYAVTGRLNSQGQIVLQGSHWILQPAGYVMVNLAGLVTQNGSQVVIAGNVGGAPGCTTFQVSR
jgi:hypothetical protein